MSNDEPRRFRVIEGGPQEEGDFADPRLRRKKYRAKRGEAEILACHVCEEETGVSTALTLEMKQGRMIRDGKPEGGSKVIYCAHCLARGRLTRLI